jgi:hypothetical protein
MEQLTIKPMQWGKIADLHEVPSIKNDDIICMKEIREVLSKHGKLDRFALHLIHKHFDISDDEILVEYNDVDTREQYFKVEKLSSETLQYAIPTTWTLDQLEPMARCVCAYRSNSGHLGRHETGKV